MGKKSTKKQVFEGIKVADFAWAGVGPMVGRELAEHGATVIRVESHQRPDSLRGGGPFPEGQGGINRSGMFAAFNTNKYGMSLDLSTAGAKEVAKRLVAWADIVTDSMTPGTMAGWGLDYESCRKINPAVIYFSTTQQGQDGPHRNFRGFGHHANAVMGISSATGWPDGKPTLPFTAYCDFIAPWYLLVSVIGGLLRRRKTGKGMYIEQSQFEAGLSFMAPHLLDYSINHHVLGRMGNHDRYMCPHALYPCRGEDRWVAIAVANDDQWKRFCEAIGLPGWSGESRFLSFSGRKQNEDELDRLIGEWTQAHTPEQVMSLLQNAGVAAGVVESGEDLLRDPQLKHRQHYRVLEHPEIGPHSYNAPAYRLSKTPCELERPAPCLGGHNEYVYKEILGFSGQEIQDMLEAGVITKQAT
jgi:benzylsuccinate CoA-transferase BbsF subunit